MPATQQPDEELAIARLVGAPFLAYVLNVRPDQAQARLDGTALAGAG